MGVEAGVGVGRRSSKTREVRERRKEEQLYTKVRRSGEFA